MSVSPPTDATALDCTQGHIAALTKACLSDAKCVDSAEIFRSLELIDKINRRGAYFPVIKAIHSAWGRIDYSRTNLVHDLFLFLLKQHFLTHSECARDGRLLLETYGAEPLFYRKELDAFWLAWATSLHRLGRGLRGAAVLRLRLRRGGSSALIHRRLAMHELLQAGPERALALYQSEVMVNSPSGDADWLYLCHLHFLTRDFAGAEKALSNVRGTDSLDFWLMTANLHSGQRRQRPAYHALERYFELAGLACPAPAVSEGGTLLANLGSLVPCARPRQVNRQPLVSVIMCVYNCIHTVEYAMRSVLAQSHENIEVILIDDGSDDGTLQLLRGLERQDGRIVLLSNEGNLGLYRSRNRGLRVCQGDYVTFHDADDWMHMDHIACHLSAMMVSPSLLCTYSNWARVDGVGVFKYRQFGGFHSANPSSIFFARSLVDKVGGFDAFRFGADTEFLARINMMMGWSKIEHIDRPLALGLFRPGSLTSDGIGGADKYRYSAPRERYQASWVRQHMQSYVGQYPINVPLDAVASIYA